MMDRIINFFYPFLSIGVIEFGSLITNMSNLLNAFIFLLQLSIGVLTIVKLWHEIKKKKFKSLENTEKTIEKKHPFISAILKYLQNFKK